MVDYRPEASWDRSYSPGLLLRSFCSPPSLRFFYCRSTEGRDWERHGGWISFSPFLSLCLHVKFPPFHSLKRDASDQPKLEFHEKLILAFTVAGYLFPFLKLWKGEEDPMTAYGSSSWYLFLDDPVKSCHDGSSSITSTYSLRETIPFLFIVTAEGGVERKKERKRKRGNDDSKF